MWRIAWREQDLKAFTQYFCKEIFLFLSLPFCQMSEWFLLPQCGNLHAHKTISIKSSRRRFKRERDDKTETTLKTALWMCYFERATLSQRSTSPLLHQPREKNANGIIYPAAEVFYEKAAFFFFAHADKTVYQKCLSSVVLCKYSYQAKRYAINWVSARWDFEMFAQRKHTACLQNKTQQRIQRNCDSI